MPFAVARHDRYEGRIRHTVGGVEHRLTSGHRHVEEEVVVPGDKREHLCCRLPFQRFRGQSGRREFAEQ